MEALAPSANSGVEREYLVVAGEESLVEALVVGVTFLNVAQVPLAVKGGGVAGFREDLGDGHLLAAHPMHFEQHADVVHAAADREATGRCRRHGSGCSRLRCTCA